jgi:hypothetical protein
MWKLLLLSCVLALSSASRAQDKNEKEWARHMKAGAKEYQEGLLKKYYQLKRARRLNLLKPNEIFLLL